MSDEAEEVETAEAEALAVEEDTAALEGAVIAEGIFNKRRSNADIFCLIS